MKSKFVRRLWAAALTLVMAVSLLSPSALAVGTVNEVKKKEGTNGSIVVTVYDKAPGSTGTGAQVSNLSNPVGGVGINALRIGDVVELTSTDDNKNVTTQVAFGLTETVANTLGLKTANAIASKNDGDQGTVYYFEPTKVQTALSDKNKESNGQTGIEDFVSDSSNKTNQVTNSNGVATFSGLQYGLYLLAKSKVPSDATTDLVPFLVSVPMYVEDATPNAGWQSTVYAYPKVRTGDITIAKTVDDGDGNIYADGDIYVNAGQTLKYTVTVNIPQSNAADGTGSANKFDSFVITDTNAKKTLDVTTSTIAVTRTYTTDEGVEQTEPKLQGTDKDMYDQMSPNQAQCDYYYEYNDNDANSVLTITLTETGLAKLNGQLANPQTLVLTYEANVATDVAFNTELTNTAMAAYHRDGMETGSASASVADEKSNTVTLYTYGIDLTKTLSDTSDTIAADDIISFELYKTYNNNTLGNSVPVNSVGANGTYWQAANAVEPDTNQYTMEVTTGSHSGNLSLYGLEPGTYYLKEVQTKTGYTLLEKPITIVITEAGNANKATATIDGANAQITNGRISLSVENTKNATGFTLPKTGGAGTLLASVVGLGLICAAIILLVIYRKKGRKNS